MSDQTTATGGYSVGRMAALSGVTIRTLHHYDEIGLLSPGGRSDTGYRVYQDSDLERLQRILFYGRGGFDVVIDDVATFQRREREIGWDRKAPIAQRRLTDLQLQIGLDRAIGVAEPVRDDLGHAHLRQNLAREHVESPRGRRKSDATP